MHVRLRSKAHERLMNRAGNATSGGQPLASAAEGESGACRAAARKRAWSAWNVFASEAAEGYRVNGQVCFAALGQAYQLLDQVAKEALQKTADEINRLDVEFGPSGRLRKRARTEQQQVMDGVSAELGLPPGSAHRRASCSSDAGGGSTSAIAPASVAPRPSALQAFRTVQWHDIRKAKAAQHLLRERSRQEHSDMELACRGFCMDESDTGGQGIIKSVGAIVPARLLGGSQPMPHLGNGIQRLRWFAPGLEEKAKFFSTMDGKQRGVQYLHAALDTVWQNYNVTVEPETWSEEPPTQRLSKCCANGMCVCSGLGKHYNHVDKVAWHHLGKHTLSPRPGKKGIRARVDFLCACGAPYLGPNPCGRQGLPKHVLGNCRQRCR